MVLLIFSAIFFALLEPSVSAAKGGIIFHTGLGSFYIPGENPINITVFPKIDPQLEKIVKTNLAKSNATFGVVIKNFETGQEYSFNQDEKFRTASLYKLMTMATVYERVKDGALTLSQSVIRRIYNMITVSDNEDAIYLSEMVGWNTIQKVMNRYGLAKTTLGSPPISTPRDVATYLELLHDKKLVNETYSEVMYRTLLEQKVNDRIPRNLPEGTKVAHKTGELDDVRHDVGIVETPNNTYMIVLMSKNMENEVRVKNIMADISKEVFDYFENQWVNKPSIL